MNLKAVYAQAQSKARITQQRVYIIPAGAGAYRTLTTDELDSERISWMKSIGIAYPPDGKLARSE